MNAPPILSLRDLSFKLGRAHLFQGLELHMGARDRAVLVGRNGSGKSTLLKTIAGLIEPDGGERWVQPGTSIAYLDQDPDLSPYATIADFMAEGLGEEGTPDDYRIALMAEELGIDPTRAPSGLSGGEARKAALIRTLVGEPEMLLLDEPTNHLDIHAIEWLEARLAGFDGAMLTISHDRAFLERLSNCVLWLDQRQIKRLDKSYSHFEDWSLDLIEQEKLAQHKLDRLIEQERIWSVEGISGRRRRNMGRVRRLGDLREQRRDNQRQERTMKIEVEQGQTSGKRVIEAFNVSKAFGERTLFKPFDLKIARGDRIGLVGPNGAGKTTLIRLLMGEETPDSGSVKHGTNLEATWVDQRRDALKEAERVWDFIADVGGDSIVVQGKAKHVVTYLRDFGFTDDQVRSPISGLSGGERNRLLLAKKLANPSNLLILDEPTNDLDIESLDLMQEMLDEYEGTVLLVSHDRDFIDRVVTSTLLIDGSGTLKEFAGGFSDMVTQGGWVPKGATLKPTKAAKGEAKPKAIPKPKEQKTGLSFTQAARLEVLPAEIDDLTSKITALETKLADPNLYTDDPDRFAKITQAHATLAEARDTAEMEWLELEELASA